VASVQCSVVRSCSRLSNGLGRFRSDARHLSKVKACGGALHAEVSLTRAGAAGHRHGRCLCSLRAHVAETRQMDSARAGRTQKNPWTVQQQLQRRTWPGNVRELKAAAEPHALGHFEVKGQDLAFRPEGMLSERVADRRERSRRCWTATAATRSRQPKRWACRAAR
jgi:hypothetical protein